MCIDRSVVYTSLAGSIYGKLPFMGFVQLGTGSMYDVMQLYTCLACKFCAGFALCVLTSLGMQISSSCFH